jgi:hypothetical protein
MAQKIKSMIQIVLYFIVFMTDNSSVTSVILILNGRTVAPITKQGAANSFAFKYLQWMEWIAIDNILRVTCQMQLTSHAKIKEPSVPVSPCVIVRESDSLLLISTDAYRTGLFVEGPHPCHCQVFIPQIASPYFVIFFPWHVGILMSCNEMTTKQRACGSWST